MDEGARSTSGTSSGAATGGPSIGSGKGGTGASSAGSAGTAVLDPDGKGSGGASPSGGSASAGTAGAGTSTGGASSEGGAGGEGGALVEEPPPEFAPQAGTLTAGAWDDNRNFDFFSSYRQAMLATRQPGLLGFTAAEHEEAFERFVGQLSSRETLDVALVIDTTGSMGDEMAYLRTEFLALTRSIDEAYPNAEQRWALVVYRDEGDLYVVRSTEFTDDLTAYLTNLGQQSADGGGDIPEAPDQALAATAALDWRTGGATARLAFWVADAPHHAERTSQMTAAVRAVRDADVHLYPVASSGVDELTELSMRSAAQLTGGRYLFLTDDSGIGGAHKEPTIPCYFVTRLDAAIRRMVDIELTGNYREPAPSEIIRTGGNPKNGRCAVAAGDVQIF
jgi:hypothetical protein